MAPRPLPQIWSSPSPPTIAETLLKQDPKYQNQGSSVRMKKGHESATGGQHNLTTRCCDVQYLGLVGARVWLGLGLVRLSLCLLDATYDVLAPVSPSSHYIHSMARVSAFFLGAPRRKNEVYQTCACGISQHVWQSLFPPIARETAHTDFCQTASWAKTCSNKLFEKSALMPQTGGPLAMNSWQWFNTRTSAVAGKNSMWHNDSLLDFTVFEWFKPPW